MKKQLEEMFERKDRVRSPYKNNLNRSAGLNGNCTTPSSCELGKRVCLDAPRKRTKSWDQVSVQKVTKVSQSRKRSIARENRFYRASWRRWCTKIRDAPAEKRPESKVQRSSTRTEMLFLWSFSAPCCERDFQSTLHNFKPHFAFKRMELAALAKQW